jgi:hypothetical protein
MVFKLLSFRWKFTSSVHVAALLLGELRNRWNNTQALSKPGKENVFGLKGTVSPDTGFYHT